MSDSVVRARIEKSIKVEASAVLASMGLNMSDAIRLMMMRIATNKEFPFSPIVPNRKTLAAMRAARAGKVVRVGRPANLLKRLNAGR